MICIEEDTIRVYNLNNGEDNIELQAIPMQGMKEQVIHNVLFGP
jgi:hypothetical protein